MAKTKISEFNANPALNTDIDSINIAEGCAPSGINDAIRELMSQLKDFQQGTAGDSFNGPVGTTTAAAGAFTTLSSTGNTTLGDASGDSVTINGTATFANANPTLSAGTANGVAYLNGSKVVTSGSALTFDGTALQTSAARGTYSLKIYNGSDGSVAGNFGALSGNVFAIDATGPANTMTFLTGGSEQMRLTSTGLGIGTSSVISGASGRGNVTVNGSSDAFLVLGTGGTRRGGLYTQGSLLTVVNDTSTLTLETNGATRATLDSSGNLGLGVTPSAWGANFRALQLKDSSNLHGVFTSGNGATEVGSNYYNNGTNDIYTSSWLATKYRQLSGVHSWYTTATGTAGNAITFTQAMTLDASGNLGVGTTSPSFPLDVVSNSAANAFKIRARSGNDYGFMQFSSNDGATRWAEIFGIPSGLVFTTGSLGTERARIDSSGNLLVGKTSTGSAAGLTLYGQSTISGYGRIDFNKTVTGTVTGSEYSYNGTPVGTITYSNTATAYNTSSDYRLKNVIGAVTGAGERIDALEPIEYEWKSDGSRTRGFLAHKFQEVYAGSVTGTKDAVDADGKPVYQAMQAGSSEVIADLVAEIQSLRKRLADAGL